MVCFEKHRSLRCSELLITESSIPLEKERLLQFEEFQITGEKAKMEANKPLRRSKRKRDLPTSDVAGGMETSKRSKRQQGEMPLQKSSPDRSGLRQEQPVDTGDSSVASEFMDVGDNARDLQQMGQVGEGTSSDSDAETEGRMGRKRKHQQTKTASSSTAKRRVTRGGVKKSRLLPGCPDVDSGSSSQAFQVTIHQLDDLVLTETFGKLDTKTKGRVARVCKKWRDLVESPAVWKHTTVRLDPRRLSSAHLDSLKRRGITRVDVTRHTSGKNLRRLIYGLPSLERLFIFRTKMTNCRLAEVFPEALPSLKMLGLRLDMLDIKTMDYVGHFFQNLSDLEVYVHCNQELLNVPDQPQKMPCLTSLRVRNLELGDQMLHYLSQAFPNLKKLSATLKSDVTDDGTQQLAQLEEIQQLELSGCTFPPLSSTLTAKLPNLQVLRVFGMTDANDEHLDALAQLPELEELRMGDWFISNEGWRALGRGFRKLKCLTLDGVYFSDDTEVEHFGSLLSLEKITFQSLRATALPMKSLCSALNHVNSLTIIYSLGKKHHYMKDIGDMENLKEFRLGYTAVGDKEVKKLAKGKAPLENLALVECNIKGKSLLYIAKRKKSIRKLKFYPKLEVATLCEIVEKLPDLQELTTCMGAATKRRLQSLKPGLLVQV